MESNKRNGTIDFFKFVCAVMIAAYHIARNGVFDANDFGGKLFHCGSIAVEFYFIVSGYLLAAKAANDSGGSVFNANLRMIRRKFLHIFAYLYPAVWTANAIRMIPDYSPSTLAHNLFYTVPELLNLQMLGFPLFSSTYVSWYLSALVFASFLIYPFLRKHRELCSKYVAPVCALFFYGLVARQNNMITNVLGRHGVTYSGMLRGIAGIFLGGTAYEISLYFNRLEDEDRPLLGAFEIFGYVCLINYGVFASESSNLDFLLLFLLPLSVSVSFSNKSVLNRFFHHTAFNFLGNLSFSIYLSHGAVMVVLRDLPLKWAPVPTYALYFAIVLPLSLCNLWVGGKLAKSVDTARKALFLIFLLAVIAEALRIMCDMLGL